MLLFMNGYKIEPKSVTPQRLFQLGPYSCSELFEYPLTMPPSSFLRPYIFSFVNISTPLEQHSQHQLNVSKTGGWHYLVFLAVYGRQNVFFFQI